jgi:flagellar motor switch/type III secretory pathway protein FliN
VVSPYPWEALERIPKNALGSISRARRSLTALDLERVADVLAALIETPVAIELGSFGSGVPARRGAEVSLRAGAATIVIGLEPDLAVALLSRVLGRPFSLSESNARLAPPLQGALAALAVEVTRRVSSAPVVLGDDASVTGAALYAELVVRLEGRPYRAYAAVQGDRLVAERSASPLLEGLGDFPLAIPLVGAVSLATREDLARLVPGSAFLPSEPWIDENGHGRGVLAAASCEKGVWVNLPPDGRIVLGHQATELAVDAEDSGAEITKANEVNETLTDAALDAPVVVRVELGAVSLPARAWAELEPGDVLETGHATNEPVILRIAGRAVARGELVSIDGEVGVRIRDLLGRTSGR